MSLTAPLLFFLIHTKYMTTAVTDEDTTDVTVKVTATDIPTGTLYEDPGIPIGAVQGDSDWERIKDFQLAQPITVLHFAYYN